MAKNRKPMNSETKLELAKSIAEKSESIKKTYENIENSVIKAGRMISSTIDSILFNPRFMKYTALFLAIFFYLIINGGAQDTLFMNNIKQSVELKDVAVITNVSDSVYEVSGLPESVDVMVRGDANDVQFASQQQSNYQILADLSELKEGKHEVTLVPLNFSDKVEVTLNPSTVIVTIQKKVTRSFAIGYDFINTDELDKIYSLGTPEFSQAEVMVRASEQTMSEISYVKALIDVSKVKADFEKEAKLVAYDQTGTKIDVDILPDTVSVKVKVTTPSKKVGITLVPEGKMPDGKAISSYELDYDEVTIYGSLDILSGIEDIKLSVPVSSVNEDTTITMPLVFPTGVTKGDVTKVKVTLKVSEATSKTVSSVPIVLENIPDGYKASIQNDLEKVDVKVIGNKSVIDKIKAEDLYVSVDLAKYNMSGTYEVLASVIGENGFVEYVLEKNTISIIMEEK